MKIFKKLVSHAMFLFLAGACSSSQHADSINLTEIFPAQISYHAGDVITAMTDENCADCKIIVAGNQLPKTFYTDIVPAALTDNNTLTVPTGQVPLVDCNKSTGCYVDVWVRSADNVESNHIQIFVSNNEETGNPAIDECLEGTEWDGAECVVPEITPVTCASNEILIFGKCAKLQECAKDNECSFDNWSCQAGYCKPKTDTLFSTGSFIVMDPDISKDTVRDDKPSTENTKAQEKVKVSNVPFGGSCIQGNGECAADLYCDAKKWGAIGLCAHKWPDTSGTCTADYQCLSKNCDAGICGGPESIKKPSYSFVGATQTVSSIGGLSTENYSQECGDDEYVFAVAVHSGAEVDTIHVECEKLSNADKNNYDNIKISNLSSYEGEVYNQKYITQTTANGPEFLTGFAAYVGKYLDKHVVIQGLAPTVSLINETGVIGQYSALDKGKYWGEKEGTLNWVDCPIGSIITGIHGFKGDRLDNVGLSCKKIKLD